ncbi:MAG: PIN domain-containing protein [Vicingaceae bacterium]
MAKRELVFLDTHVVVWLYLNKKVFSEKARQLMSNSQMRISPMVRLELQLLHQKKRIAHPFKILTSLKRDFYFDEESADFSQLITQSLSINFSRDPFDRLIVAQAKLAGNKLVTKDRDILENFEGGVW